MIGWHDFIDVLELKVLVVHRLVEHALAEFTLAFHFPKFSLGRAFTVNFFMFLQVSLAFLEQVTFFRFHVPRGHHWNTEFGLVHFGSWGFAPESVFSIFVSKELMIENITEWIDCIDESYLLSFCPPSASSWIFSCLALNPPSLAMYLLWISFLG